MKLLEVNTVCSACATTIDNFDHWSGQSFSVKIHLNIGIKEDLGNSAAARATAIRKHQNSICS